MTSTPAVIVKKGGFLNGLFYGFFGFLITTVVCATGLGIYGMRIADSKAVQAITTAERLFTGIPDWLDGVFTALPNWQEALPPAMSDALHDRRAPDYEGQLDVAVRLAPARRGHRAQRAVVEVANRGPETITVMAVRLVVTDEDGVPISERSAYVATPLTIEDEWRGPLMPGSTRKFAVTIFTDDSGDYDVSHEITELRVWEPEQPTPTESLSMLSDAEAASAGVEP